MQATRFLFSKNFVKQHRISPIYQASLQLSLEVRGFSTTVVPSAKPITKDTSSSLKSKWKIYSDLTKFRLSSLVVFTSAAGYLFAGGPVDIATMAYACVGTGLCAASACTFNEVYEVDADAAMNRTKSRPIPSGKITKNTAIGIGVANGLAGTALLYAMTNPVVAFLGAANIALYAGPYTYSKQKTELNTWIGSVVGAIPPIMGWCAATASDLTVAEPYIIGSLLFLWQFPHFFALSWLHREDYARGKFQMVPVNDSTGIRTANLISEYSIYLTMLPIVTTALGYTSSMFVLEGTAVNMYLLYLSKKFHDNRSNANARKLFLCSLWYLPALLFGLVFYSKNWSKEAIEEKEKALLLLTSEEGNELLDQEERRNIPAGEKDKITEMFLNAKETLKGLCFHEILTHQDDKSNTAPHLCLKKVSDQVR
jgi:protoheme IX farnesyltransferase